MTRNFGYATGHRCDHSLDIFNSRCRNTLTLHGYNSAAGVAIAVESGEFNTRLRRVGPGTYNTIVETLLKYGCLIEKPSRQTGEPSA